MAKAKNTRKTPVKKVARRIYFYRAISSFDKPKQPAFNPNAALEPLANLIDDSVASRCMTEKDGREYCCWVNKTRKGKLKKPQTVIFGSIRRSDLPQKIKGVKLLSMRMGADSGLVEKIHIVFFPNNIIGADYNFYGPRMTKFADYLRDKVEDHIPKDIHFDFLLRQDVMVKLQQMKEVRLFNLRVRASYIEQISRANKNLAEAFKIAKDFSKAEDVEIVLRAAPHTTGNLSRKLLKIARSLMHSKGIHHSALNFSVRGLDKETERMVELDLLSDKLISVQYIRPINARSKALDSNSAFKEIKEAHKKLESQLLKAAGAEHE
jgi:hypothetical protein